MSEHSSPRRLCNSFQRVKTLLKRWGFLPVVAALLLSCGGGEEGGAESTPRNSVEERIINGEFDADPAHRAVVALIMGNRLCSGTLVSRRVVLTAAHCLDGVNAASVEVGFGTDVESRSTRWIGAEEVLPHPDYDSALLVNDLGLIRLDTDPPADVRPIPVLPAGRGLTQSDVGALLTFAGFGTTSSGAGAAAGVKFRVDGPLAALCLGPLPCRLENAKAAAGTLCYSQSPGGPCLGDSGGPALLERDGTLYVAGITSYGDRQCEVYGCSTVADRFESFIQAFGAEGTLTLGSACSQAQSCASGYCVDGVCCNRACAGAPCEQCVRALGAEVDGQCAPVSAECDDGDHCSTDDRCEAGRCAGSPIACGLLAECAERCADEKPGERGNSSAQAHGDGGCASAGGGASLVLAGLFALLWAKLLLRRREA